MRRAIQKELEDPLSMLLLEGSYPLGTVFVADALDGKITVQPVLQRAGQAESENARPVTP